MRADALVLALVLLATGCASVSQVPGRGRSVSYAPREASSPAWVEAPSDEPSHARNFLPRALAGPDQRLLRRQQSRDDVTAVGDGAIGGEVRSNALTRQAVLDATKDVKGSLTRVEAAFTQLAARPPDLWGWSLTGVFTRYLDQGSKQVTWLQGALGSATVLTEVASEVGDTDIELGLLRMTGPKLQAAPTHTGGLHTDDHFIRSRYRIRIVADLEPALALENNSFHDYCSSPRRCVGHGPPEVAAAGGATASSVRSGMTLEIRVRLDGSRVHVWHRPDRHCSVMRLTTFGLMFGGRSMNMRANRSTDSSRRGHTVSI